MRDEHPIGCHCGFSNEPWFCSRSAPTPSELPYIFNLVGKFGSKTFRMGADVIKVFTFSISSSWGFRKLKATYFFKSARSGAVTSARFGINFPR